MTLFDSIENFADRTAVITEDGSRKPYADLINRGHDLLTPLPPRSLVLMATRNCFDTCAVYVEMLRSKHVPILVSASTSDTDIAALARSFRPSAVILPSTAKAPDGYGRAGTAQGAACALYMAAAPHRPALHADLALLISTSGSTGGGSFVRLSRKNLLSNTDAIKRYLPITCDDVAITTMPMSYSYGLSIINTHLSSGAAVVATEQSLVRPDFWKLVKDHHVTSLSGVPFIHDMLKKLRFADMDLPSLRYLTQAGGRLSAELALYMAESCASRSIPFFAMYGQTEATARISYLDPGKLAAKPDSIGKAIPGGTMYLEGENGEIVSEAGREGEIIYKGDNVCMGLASTAPDLANGDGNKGILRTGDLGCFDADGDFKIMGRLKRILKLYGNRVNLDELDRQLADAGFDAVTTGQDDHLVVATEAGEIEETLRKWVISNTSIPPKAVQVRQIDCFPRKNNGKIDYAALARDVGDSC